MCTGAESNQKDSFSEVEKSTPYCFARRMGILQARASNCVPHPGGSAEELYSNSGVANKD